MNSLTQVQNLQVESTDSNSSPENPAKIYLAGLAMSGRRTMKGKLARVCQMIGHTDPLTFSWHLLRHEHLVAVRSHLQEIGKSPATINATLSALRGVATAAFNTGLLNAEDYQRLKNVKSVRGSRLPAGRGLSRGELRALFSVCGEDPSPAGRRDAALLALLYAGGLRRTSIVELDLEHFDPETGELKVLSKGNSEYLTHLGDGGLDAVVDWVEVRGSDPGPLFHPINKSGRIIRTRMSDQSLYNVLVKRCKEAGVTPANPHDMRRSFVSDLLDSGVDLSTVQKMANHQNVATTARYDRRGERAKKKAAKTLHVPYVSAKLS